jgi:alanine racemase
MIRFSLLEPICSGKLLSIASDLEVKTLLTDSRKLGTPEGVVFFAISGSHNNGHAYIEALYLKGVRQFVVEESVPVEKFAQANILRVNSSVKALQALASYHRQLFSIPIIGITGSNGKTIIKEWLSTLLGNQYNMVKSPGSYNSQLGVPLSVWQLEKHHQLGIFEAGISRVGEMEKLQPVIRPTVGIFSNIGTAHSEGFQSQTQKIVEKLKLFQECPQLIYCNDHIELAAIIEKSFDAERLVSWGSHPQSAILWKLTSGSQAKISYRNNSFQLNLPFTDKASLENIGHCIAVMILFGCDQGAIQQQLDKLKKVPMRLELKEAINNCQLIDDSYNNDLGGLRIGLDFLASSSKKHRAVIISDIFQTGLPEKSWVNEMVKLVQGASVTMLVGIGAAIHRHAEIIKESIPNCEFYTTTRHYLESGNWNNFKDSVILVKGARDFQFEGIVQRIEKKIHGTVLELDLGAMVSNLNLVKSQLKPSVKLMVMVKAFAYGSGAVQVASLLQYHKVDYLGVAYADEGVELRKNGIKLPIMVMNPSTESFGTILENKLEPEIYSVRMLNALLDFLDGREISIHLKIDTGMHRLGFIESEVSHLVDNLKRHPNIKVASLFSHLAAADERQHDEFTDHQVSVFKRIADHIKDQLKINPILHILNSSGIMRFPDFQFNMVRLGISLYGINPTEENLTGLKPVATLKTVISQIKVVTKGETVGYGRAGKVGDKPVLLATIAIGYADGFSRAFSKGIGKVWINGKLAPVIGNVCMDMTMVDISEIEAQENDEVIIFGKEYPIEKVAASINTIPYEILTNTSERVKRVFFAESL